ncbi:MAG: TonB family protein [Terriglobales bacterium]|jgi:protein TonB
MAAPINDLAHGGLGRPLAWSAGLHVAFSVFIILYATFIPGFHGQGWGAGGGGEAMGATLVSSVPLPANPQQTQSVLATESKGLSQSQPKPQEKEPEAIPIPDKNTKLKNKPALTATARKPEPEPQQSNQIPYGEGGPVSGPYAMFNAGGAKGGFGFTGGGGDFGSRFSWYVQAVQRKVSENWLRYEVDPGIREANRVYVTFDIGRDGHPSHVVVEQSSGVPSLDISATRAVQRIDTFGPLPPEYSGSKVSVEFWFDYRK